MTIEYEVCDCLRLDVIEGVKVKGSEGVRVMSVIFCIEVRYGKCEMVESVHVHI